MEQAGHTDAAAIFDPMRPRLVRVAYRMLGSLADAEDVVQDAFIRWHATDRDVVREPEAFLRRVVMRERLSPLERAAFLLHDVFGVSFEEIAETIGREPAACRQLASRARTQVRADRPRFKVPKERGLEIAEAFFTASRSGDMHTLQSLMAKDVASYADGGGKRPAVMNPLVGIETVMKLHTGLARLFAQRPSKIIRYAFVNGLPGFVTMEGDNELQTTGLYIEDGRILGIYVMRNPDKLRRVEASTH